jgi:hypothetical protein
MADFSTPFGSVGGNTRLPTEDERDDGFPCGPADRSLFNGMFRRIEAELDAIVQEGGITPSDSDDTTVLQAILALIDAATGGGDTSNFVLMSQARARLPIFPDVLHADGHLNITSPSTGQVRVPAGRVFQHRGIYQITTVQTDFATLSSKTYHLRWNPTDGFTLNDLADTGYNPSALAETVSAFDSTFDDMLVARVVTNSSNVATITNLLNRVRLTNQATFRTGIQGALDWTVLSATAVALNWARTPLISTVALNEFRSNNTGPGIGITPTEKGIIRAIGARIPATTRYGTSNIEYYYEDNKAGTSADDGLFSIILTALAV